LPSITRRLAKNIKGDVAREPTTSGAAAAFPPDCECFAAAYGQVHAFCGDKLALLRVYLFRRPFASSMISAAILSFALAWFNRFNLKENEPANPETMPGNGYVRWFVFMNLKETESKSENPKIFYFST
jgi:hypothetical protein